MMLRPRERLSRCEKMGRFDDLTSANFHNFLNDPFLLAMEFGAYESQKLFMLATEYHSNEALTRFVTELGDFLSKVEKRAFKRLICLLC